MKVAFQGLKGAYSEEAIYKHFGKEAEARGFDLSRQVLDALREAEVEYAILPVENSIVGNVGINLDLIYSEEAFAIAEVYLPIQHCLLAHHGLTLKDLTHVKSHPIALEQCHDFLDRHHLKAIAEFDTAGASHKLSLDSQANYGSISSKLCAEYYGLNILETNIQKVKNNITRFLILKKPSKSDFLRKGDKVSLAFNTKHTPGALLECLQVFASHKLNLTKLQSRPIPEDPFTYTFFIDFLGSLEQDNVSQCLSKLNELSRNLKILGLYSQSNP